MTLESESKRKKDIIILDMFRTLITGGIIRKNEIALREGKDVKTIGRYIEDLQEYFFTASNNEDEYVMEIVKDKNVNGYVLQYRENAFMTKEEVLVIAKILLESRALTKEDMSILLKKITSNCCLKDRSEIEKIIFSEKIEYTEPNHKDNDIIQKVWRLSEAVRKKNKVNIIYNKLGQEGKADKKVNRMILPQGVLFSEYYFYLIAVIDREKDIDVTRLVPYRIDRILEYEILEEKYRISEKDKVKEGEIRQLNQYMHFGELDRVTFKFKGGSIEAILDKLPTAKVIREDNGEYIVRAKGYNEGIKMFLLSQGDRVEIIESMKFRKDMESSIEKMLYKYKE